MKKVLLGSFLVIFSIEVFCSSNQDEMLLNDNRETSITIGMSSLLPPTATREQIDEFIALQREILEIQRKNYEELARCNALKEQEQALREKELAAKIKHDADMLAIVKKKKAVAPVQASNLSRRSQILRRVAYLDEVIRKAHFEEVEFASEYHYKGLSMVTYSELMMARSEKENLLAELSGLRE